MSFVRVQRLSYAYGGGRNILEDVDFSLDKGFLGVVGENGGGKSTLLRLLAGDLEPTRGTVDVGAAPIERVLCRQEAAADDPLIACFKDRFERADLRWRSRFELRDEDAYRQESLSPGERKRWQLAAALASSPRLLLLDEPTNHLDEAGRALLVAALSCFGGAAVIVSHDRTLLDAVCTQTMRIEGGRASVMAQPYSRAARVWAEREAADAHDARKQTRELRRLRRHASSLRDARARAENAIPASRRIKGPRDSDARSVVARTRVASGERALARRLAATNSRVQRQAETAASATVTVRRGGAIAFDGARSRRRRLAHHRGPLRVGQRTLAADLRVEIERDTRLRIAGANGCGKTTLLERLVASTPLSDEELLYLRQDLGAADEQRLRTQLGRQNRDELGEVMTVAATLGLDPDAVMTSPTWSPGQLRKLLLAQALSRQVSLLVLDEPTNHLDLPSVERIEEALADYPGAVVVVTHDPRFASALALDCVDLSRASPGP